MTVLGAGVTAFVMADMIVHNRRKRTAFYNEQHLMYTQRLLTAIETEKAGLPMTADDQLVLDRERAKLQADEERSRNSWKNYMKNILVGGLKTDMREEPDYVNKFEGGVIPSEAEVLQRLGVDDLETLEAAKSQHVDQVASTVPTSNSPAATQDIRQDLASISGGSLDLYAANLGKSLHGIVRPTS